MAIANVSYSNTFAQWLISTNQSITDLNALKSGAYTKSDGILYLYNTTPGSPSLETTSPVNLFNYVNIKGQSSLLVVDNKSTFSNTINIIAGSTSINAVSEIISNGFLNKGYAIAYSNTYTFQANTLAPTTNTEIIVARTGLESAIIRWDNINFKWKLKDVSNTLFYNILTDQDKTSLATANTLVFRDSTTSFSANSITSNLSSSFINVSANIASLGFINSANIINSGFINSTGNITAPTHVATTLITTPVLNVATTINSANIINSGTINSTGNITAPIIVATSLITTPVLNVATTINSANIINSGTINSTGNITAPTHVATTLITTPILTVATTINSANIINSGTINSTGTVTAPTLNVSSAINSTGVINSTNIINSGTVTTPTLNSSSSINSTNIINSGTVTTPTLNSSSSINSTNIINSGTINSTGNITAPTHVATSLITTPVLNVATTINSANIINSGTINSTGNITAPTIVATSLITTPILTVATTINSANIINSGTITSTGNITAPIHVASTLITTPVLNVATTLNSANIINSGTITSSGTIIAPTLNVSSAINSTSIINSGTITAPTLNVSSVINSSNIINTGTVTSTNMTVSNVINTGFLNVSGDLHVTGNTTLDKPSVTDSSSYILSAVTGASNSPNSELVVTRNKGASPTANNAGILWDNVALRWKVKDVSTLSTYYNIVSTQDISTTSTPNSIVVRDGSGAISIFNSNTIINSLLITTPTLNVATTFNSLGGANFNTINTTGTVTTPTINSTNIVNTSLITTPTLNVATTFNSAGVANFNTINTTGTITAPTHVASVLITAPTLNVATTLNSAGGANFNTINTTGTLTTPTINSTNIVNSSLITTPTLNVATTFNSLNAANFNTINTTNTITTPTINSTNIVNSSLITTPILNVATTFNSLGGANFNTINTTGTITGPTHVASTLITTPTLNVSSTINSTNIVNTGLITTPTLNVATTINSAGVLNAGTINSTGTITAPTHVASTLITTPTLNVATTFNSTGGANFNTVNASNLITGTSITLSGDLIVNGNTTLLKPSITDTNTLLLLSLTGNTASANSEVVVTRNKSGSPTANNAGLLWDNVALRWKAKDVTSNTYYTIITAQDQTGTSLALANSTAFRDSTGSFAVSNLIANSFSSPSNSINFNTDVSVSGNLTISGTSTIINANNITLKDPLIYLAANNPSNIVDIGFVGNFTGSSYQHTGLVRNYADNTWKLFSNVVSEPLNTIDFTSAIYDNLKVGVLYSTETSLAPLVVSSTTIVTNLNSDLLDGQHGTYYTTAGNLTGTIPSAVLGTSTQYIGTTAIALNRSSAGQALTGITSIDGTAAGLSTTLAVGSGGTGATSAGQALQNLIGLTGTSGQILTTGGSGSFYWSSANTVGGGGSSVGTLIQSSRVLTSATANQNVFSLGANTSYFNDPNQLRIYIDGVRQFDGYTYTANSFTFSPNPGLTSSNQVLAEIDGYYSYQNTATATSYSPTGAMVAPNANTVQLALDSLESSKATLASPTFTGTVTVPLLVSSNSQLTSVGVGTTASGVSGEIRATNNITAYYSDDRLKTKLGIIDNALEKVNSLTGFYYEANEIAQAFGYAVKREVGVSAQEVQAIMPEVVAPAPIDDKYLTVRYERLVPLLIEAIKELSAKIAVLENK